MAVSFIKLPEVERRTARRRTSIYDRVRAGVFPPPVRLGAPSGSRPAPVAWVEAEIDALNAATAAGRSEAELRALVARMVAARREGAPQ
jgi:prophage regulatory protein